jgi:asparaginyl-tRNA synthetase
MKDIFISDLKSLISDKVVVTVTGWIKNQRSLGSLKFIDLEDSTGQIQVVSERLSLSMPKGSAIKVVGTLKVQENDSSKVEIIAETIELIQAFLLDTISPLPRSDTASLELTGIDNLLSNRHLYICNDRAQTILRFRHKFFRTMHSWFDKQGFIEINAPILTEALLYKESTAFSVDYFGTPVFLTQCVGFYLEACILAFEKVYNFGPSFRAEPSHGRRHLAEYYHIKAEIAHVNLRNLMDFVQNLISEVCSEIIEVAGDELEKLNAPLLTFDLTPPYPEIAYKEAIKILNRRGFEIQVGQSLPPEAEESLSYDFDKPFFIVGLPSAVEPFPYVIDPNDSELTLTADLHAPGGFGEILGIAEKIYRRSDLENRALERKLSKEQRKRLEWYFNLRDAGCVPHGGIGMGVERTIRWLLGLTHVRDAIPFPRLFNRIPRP